MKTKNSPRCNQGIPYENKFPKNRKAAFLLASIFCLFQAINAINAYNK
jgi:hypothetical protein